ncbi:EamA family transporter [Pseudomonas sp. PS01297]|uniref:DMT family transporter n=1 Tax=Pseudomonas sp. PS01297 TaxID=2991433 RepID=UPI00249AF1B9|nr:EamA family transporter [Pseudomonas sp. PS01297]
MSRSVLTTNNSKTIGVIFVLMASILWGTTGTAATFAPSVSPLAIGAAAMGVGGLLQMLIAIRQIGIDWARLKLQSSYVLIGASAVAVYPLAFYTSMHMAGVTIGTVVTIGSAPLLSAVIERIFDNKPLTGRWAIGAGLGLLGTVMLCVAKAQGHTDNVAGASDIRSMFGILLGLVAGATYALYSWTAHRLIQKNISSSAAMGTTFGLGGLVLLPVLLVTGAPLIETWTNAMVGFYMALVPMCLGYVLFGKGLAKVSASTATTLSLIEPVVAALLAAVVVGEQLSPVGWTGAALIVSCLYVLVQQPTNHEQPLSQRTNTSTPDS